MKDVGGGWDAMGDIGITKELSPSALKEIPEQELGILGEADMAEMDMAHLFSFDMI